MQFLIPVNDFGTLITAVMHQIDSYPHPPFGGNYRDAISIKSLHVVEYGCPIEEVFPTFQSWCVEIYLVCGNIYTVRGKVVIPHIYYLCPQTFIWVRKHFSLRGNIKSGHGNLCGNLLTMHGNLFTVHGNLCAAWKYIHCAWKLMCCAEIFSSPHKFFCLCTEIIMSYAQILGFQPF